jgi:hypothetical protein
MYTICLIRLDNHASNERITGRRVAAFAGCDLDDTGTGDDDPTTASTDGPSATDP